MALTELVSNKPPNGNGNGNGLYPPSFSLISDGITSRLGYKGVAKVERLAPAYMDQLRVAEQRIGYSMMLAKVVAQDLLSQPQSEDLRTKLRTNFDHGDFHLERVKRWFLSQIASDPIRLVDPHFMQYTQAAAFAIEFHDLTELATGEKIDHDATAALFATSYLLQEQERIAQISDFSLGQPLSYDLEEWKKLAWATGFIINNHSKPEKMPSLVDIYQQASFNTHIFLELEKLLITTSQVSQKHGKSIEGFFPPFELVTPTLKKIIMGSLRGPDINILSYDAIIRNAVDMALSDKLDSTMPAGLSIGRTLQSSSLRIPHVPYDGMTLDEEYDARIASGAGHTSACDNDRLLFETSRIFPANFWSPAIATYSRATAIRGRNAWTSMKEFLTTGDGDSFLRPYRELETNTCDSALRRVGGISRGEIQKILSKSPETRADEVISILSTAGYSTSQFERILLKVREEETKVERALEEKGRKLQGVVIPPGDIDRLDKMYAHAISIQTHYSNLHGVTPPQIVLPYENYYPEV